MIWVAFSGSSVDVLIKAPASLHLNYVDWHLDLRFASHIKLYIFPFPLYNMNRRAVVVWAGGETSQSLVIQQKKTSHNWMKLLISSHFFAWEQLCTVYKWEKTENFQVVASLQIPQVISQQRKERTGTYRWRLTTTNYNIEGKLISESALWHYLFTLLRLLSVNIKSSTLGIMEVDQTHCPSEQSKEQILFTVLGLTIRFIQMLKSLNKWQTDRQYQ